MNKNRTQAFQLIYQEHRAMVLQLCLGFVKGNRMEANDLVQEIFLKVWLNLEKFRNESSYKTWIYRITVNSCLFHIKKEKRLPLAPISAQVEDLISSPDSQPPASDIQNLYAAIGGLKKLDRIIILMVLDNNEYDDIAEVLGISAVNLRVKIHRIKKQLEVLLKKLN